MKNIITTIAITLSLSCFGQYADNSVHMKAFRMYQNDKFDSAIIYYKELLNQQIDNRDDYYFMQLGKCYFELKEFENSKKYFLNCLTVIDTVYKNNYAQRESCFGLSEIYQLENNYEASLNILKLAEAKFPHRKICNAGEFERKMILNNDFSLCFEKLNMIDSAITYLTPYMFTKPDDLLIDSIDYLKLVNNYYRLLCKKASPKEVKNIFERAIKEVYYKKLVDTTNSYITTNTWYNVESYFSFFGKKVYLCNVTYDINSWGREPVKSFELSTLLEYLRSTPAYELIVDNKVQHTTLGFVQVGRTE
jgi:tetratricopeptide (TPR) repeat protein